jgi:hypothetical protein
MSNHTDFKNLVNKNSPSDIMPSCCHPTQMSSLKVRFRHTNNEIITKTLPNMIVTECGCS